MRWKVLISSERTPSAELTTGIAEILPGATLGCNRHAHAETYCITKGAGRVVIEGVESAVGPRSAVLYPGRCAAEAHCVGAEPLEFIFTFTCDRFDEVVYRYED